MLGKDTRGTEYPYLNVPFPVLPRLILHCNHKTCSEINVHHLCLSLVNREHSVIVLFDRSLSSSVHLRLGLLCFLLPSTLPSGKSVRKFLARKSRENTGACVTVQDSTGAQKHLFHISSTKGLRPGIYASVIGDPKKAILKFRNSAQQPVGVPVNTP